MPNISYFKRDFRSIREELVNFIKQNYPDTISTFNDGAVGSLLIDLIAACSDSLSYNIDRAAQENQIDYAQEKSSLFNLARTYGLKIPFRRPSVTLCDFTVTVPVKGNAPDTDYFPLIVRGAQVLGASTMFETSEDIDFISPYSQGSSIPNRTIVPNYNQSGNISSYSITKREIVTSGRTKIFKKVVTASDSVPFMGIFLPDSDVLSVSDVIVVDGTSSQTVPAFSEWYKKENKWYEVDTLSQTSIFVGLPQMGSDSGQVTVGAWERVSKKFMTEYTDKGFLKITFGGGKEIAVQKNIEHYISDASLFLNSLDKAVNTGALGEYPSSDRTMFVRYRVGGGSGSNIGAGTISSVSTVDMVVLGPNQSTNSQVMSSLTVNNPVPAFGGGGEPTVEEIRNMVKYNYAAQGRCVTILDYQNRIALMPGKFGAPYKSSIISKGGFVEISILGLTAEGKLTNLSTKTLKENLAAYLSNYKMLNDYLIVKDGKVINLSFEFDIFVDRAFDRADIVTNVINNVYSFMSVSDRQMGEDIYLSNLLETVNNVPGVINITDFRVFNKVGGNYSLNQISQPYSDAPNRQIDLLGKNLLMAANDEMFEIKYKEKDIRLRFSY